MSVDSALYTKLHACLTLEVDGFVPALIQLILSFLPAADDLIVSCVAPSGSGGKPFVGRLTFTTNASGGVVFRLEDKIEIREVYRPVPVVSAGRRAFAFCDWKVQEYAKSTAPAVAVPTSTDSAAAGAAKSGAYALTPLAQIQAHGCGGSSYGLCSLHGGASLIITGGTDGQSDHCSRSCIVFDLASKEWLDDWKHSLATAPQLHARLVPSLAYGGGLCEHASVNTHGGRVLWCIGGGYGCPDGKVVRRLNVDPSLEAATDELCESNKWYPVEVDTYRSRAMRNMKIISISGDGDDDVLGPSPIPSPLTVARPKVAKTGPTVAAAPKVRPSAVAAPKPKPVFPPRWRTAAPLQVGRRYVACAVLSSDSEAIYAVGGTEGSQEYQRTVERYDHATNAWTLVAPMSHARGEDHAVAAAHMLDTTTGVVEEKLVVCGGQSFTIAGGMRVAAPLPVEIYSPATNKWTSVPAIDAATATAACRMSIAAVPL